MATNNYGAKAPKRLIQYHRYVNHISPRLMLTIELETDSLGMMEVMELIGR